VLHIKTHASTSSPPTTMSTETRKPLPCQNPRDELIACVLRTDWFVGTSPPVQQDKTSPQLTRSVLKKGKSPAECLRNPSELPMQCQHLMSSYADCKKGMVGAPTCSILHGADPSSICGAGSAATT
jgi:hypothetical protein